MTNLVYDYETLSTDVTEAPVLSLACLRYDESRFASDNPYSFDELLNATRFYKFSIAAQITKYGRVINKDTLAWWGSLPIALREAQMSPMESDLSITELPDILKEDAKGTDRIFTRGNTFDPMITTSLCKTLGVAEPYQWWNIRDTRSYIEGLSYGAEIKNSFMPEGLEGKFVMHDPQHDIVVDVLRMQELIKFIS